MTDKDYILELIHRFIEEKHSKKTWTPGEDWVKYSGPYFDAEEYISAISSLLDEWLALGTDGLKFERTFPKHLGKEHGVFTNSGSSANLLMLAALTSKQLNGLEVKDSIVITPSAGFPTTINPIIQQGFNPLFVDIELNTLNLDLDVVEEFLQHDPNPAKQKILMFAHVLGNPPDMDRVMRLVKEYNLILLEDCCDALGSTYDDKLLGSFGDMASCSFYPAHHITTGEGGFVATSTQEQRKVVASLRDWGRGCFCAGKEANTLKDGCCKRRFSEWLPSMPGEVFDHKYVYDEIGYNLKPMELQASIGLVQMKKLDDIAGRRKFNFQRLFEIFSKYEEHFILPKATEKANPNWFAFPLTIKDGAPFDRAKFCSFLEDNKIQTRQYFGGNLLLQPAYSMYNQDAMKKFFPNATKTTTNTFFLGTSPVITPHQLDYIAWAVKEFYEHL